jgi:NAD(P)-dependent dehydrogenase (short-subunit alcohol dehydrogenase family)
MGMLDGRVAICTGSGRGVGAEVAKMMAANGAKVVVNDPGVSGSGEGGDSAPAEQVAAEIREAGGEAVANTGSVTSYEDCLGLVQQARDAFGGLHILFNPAGILRDRMFHKMSPEDWQAVIDVHLTGHFNVSRAAINLFREQEYGRIIMVGSTSGLLGNVGQANYGAAKMGIVTLSGIVAMENKSKNITSNVICPSADTRMIRRRRRSARSACAAAAPMRLRRSASSWRPSRRATSPARCSTSARRSSRSTASRGRCRWCTTTAAGRRS